MDVLLVAAKKEKIADYTGVIAQAGRVPVVVDVDAFALQNAYEVNYGLEPGAVVVLLNAGASAININILSGDQSLFTRDISIGGNAYTEAVQKELSLPFESAEQAKKGEPVDGVAVRRRPAGAARDDRERAARDSEDLRLLQGDRGVGSDRSDPAERRRLRASTASRRRSRSASTRRSRCSIRSRRSRSTPQKLGIARPRPARADRGGGRRSRASEGRATDDQDQPARRRAEGGQEEAVVALQIGPEAHRRLRADSAARRRGSSAGATGRCSSESAQLDADISAAQQETTRLHSIIHAGPAVRAAEGAAAAARRADRAAAPGPDRAGAHARPDQPGAAADAVAHRAEAGRDAERGRHRRPVHDADRPVRLRRQPRSARATSSASVEIVEQPDRGRSRDRRAS